MTEQEPQCDYCGEKAVKTVHSYADKDGTPTDHYYCEKRDKDHNTERRTDTSQNKQFFVCNLILVAIGVG